MIALTVAQAQTWRPEALARLADAWDSDAIKVKNHVDVMAREVAHSSDFWRGGSGDTARNDAVEITRDGDAVARSLILAAAAARDGAAQIAAAQRVVLDLVSSAETAGFDVADDGTVTPGAHPDQLVTTLAGGDASVASHLLDARATALTAEMRAALNRLDETDQDAARDIDEASVLALSGPTTDVVAGWPSMSQDRIAAQIASMTESQRQRLIASHPHEVGNTDGVPWDMRQAANRTNIAQAVLETGDRDRLSLYRSLLGEIDDPTGTGGRIDRQILAFDPDRASLVELNGNVRAASAMAVLVPGLNTTIEGSGANTATARRFVAAGKGDVAVITYLGGPFPRGANPVTGVIDAVNPRYAMDMAPRLVAFSEDVDRTADATGRQVPVTYIGHSYGGSILGTAEALGMTADRTMYVAAAGAGVGVDDPGDWHNRNPNVLRFSMTPPGDLIALVQGVPGGTHGADPDEMPGVVPLDSGRYDDGRPMRGPAAHSDVVNWPSDAWRNILGVITGDRNQITVAS